MKYLLDTHVFVWWLTSDKKLPRPIARAIERAEQSQARLGLSAMSLWEIAKLVERGRIELKVTLDECLSPLESHETLSLLPLTPRIAIESTRLGAAFPTDPADQLIAATARVHGLTLLTADERIIESGVVSVL